MNLDPRRITQLFASRRLATSLMVSWMALLLIWVVPFQFYRLTEAEVANIVLRERFFHIVYALVVVSLSFCMLQRLGPVIRRAARLPGAAPSGGPAPVRVEGAYEAARADRALADAGYATRVVRPEWAWGTRNRWSGLGTIVLHVGILLVMFAAVPQLDARRNFVGRAVVAEGETFDGAAASYNSVDTSAPPPALSFTLDRVTAAFHEDILLFTRLDGAVRDANDKRHTVKVSAPWIAGPATAVALEDFGYAPIVEVSALGKSKAAVYKMKVFPPGTEDSLDVRLDTPSDYRIYLKVLPDYVDRGGSAGSKSFNLSNPRFIVTPARILADRTDRRLGEPLTVGIGEPARAQEVTVTVKGVRTYGVFRVTSSPSAPFLIAALACLGIGGAVRALFPRSEAVIRSSEGAVEVAATVDLYRGAERAAVGRLARCWEEAR
ncbi:MAG: cytochrome c biogenesis protein ResB [Actinobacteria bacterium]|nr:MAG: cytochrome c biogenesis protein ResB [Actinomycetota bacterium]